MDGKSLPPNRKIAKDQNDPSINVHEVEIILLVFQLWASVWYRKKVLIHIDNTMAVAGLEDSTLRGPANAYLYQILLLADRWDVLIKLQ